MIRYIFAILFLSFISLYASTNLDQVQKSQDRLEQSLWFNKGVLELKNKNYKEAIYFFTKTKNFQKYPSLLNIAIAKYNQKQNKNSYSLFLKLIDPNIIDEDLYVYLSANIYLFKITKDKKYLSNIKEQFSHAINASDRERKILIDSYIQLDDFKKAELIIDQNNMIDKYKKGLLSLVNGNYFEAKEYLEEQLKIIYDKKTKYNIEWFLLYADLKLGNMDKLALRIDNLSQYKDETFPNDNYPISLDINLNKYDQKYYFKKIQKLDLDTKIDLVFYFTSYLFSDDAQVQYSIANSFFLLKQDMLNNLDKMTSYNKLLLKYVQTDPYTLREKLTQFKYKHKKSYMYFNLGLAFANIGEYNDALEQFKIASNLQPGNRMYVLYTLLCAKKLNKTFKGQKQLQGMLNSTNGEGIEKARFLNTLLLKGKNISKNDMYGIDDDRLGQYIEYLGCKDEDCSKLSFFDDSTDPVKNILYLNANKKQSEFVTISNIQDNILQIKVSKNSLPVVYNLYGNYMKGVGLKYKLSNQDEEYISQYSNKIESFNLQSKDNLYILAASSLNNQNTEDAYATLVLINTIYKDTNSSFLIALRYLSSQEFDEALNRFKTPLTHEYFDFKLGGLNQLLKGL